MTEEYISRQAAIEEVRKLAISLYGYDSTNIISCAIYRLQNIPSAQPEIIRCKDCKHGSPNGKYGCRVYHYRRYETHDMKPDDFCSYAERRIDE